MENQSNHIHNTIEMLRSRINQLAKGRKLTDPEVLTVSCLLDKALNEHYNKEKEKNAESSL